MSSCDGNCSNCSKECASRTMKKEDFLIKTLPGTNIKKVIGVVSGKGGVGKSMVTSLLACAASRKGYNTAILDGDVTGPSIPQAFGLKGQLYANEEGTIPALTASGIKVISTNLILQDETMPVIWRSPIITGLVKQFYSEVIWGDVDYMFVDLPPGTGDVPLTVFQSLPLDGIIVVSSPQQLVSMIVQKAVNMAKMMEVKVIGLVENMSFVECDNCGNQIHLFGSENSAKLAEKHGIELLAQIPLNPALSKMVDEGRIEEYPLTYVDKVLEAIEKL